jgi:hypothetical protein
MFSVFKNIRSLSCSLIQGRQSIIPVLTVVGQYFSGGHSPGWKPVGLSTFGFPAHILD